MHQPNLRCNLVLTLSFVEKDDGFLWHGSIWEDTPPAGTLEASVFHWEACFTSYGRSADCAPVRVQESSMPMRDVAGDFGEAVACLFAVMTGIQYRFHFDDDGESAA